ncbi:hypothetical protein DE146DRAFT_732943 [Phaeosphaeria sp. MPI-PUGE-AT-0046c]|nr:hypothetical protein DE146DRAFT_732943 [Phaeosphaeria sp. MPI-PUGE-AT-0046c]
MRYLIAPSKFHTLENVIDIVRMVGKNTIKAREARKRRGKLQKKRLRIDVLVELRTLKRPARKQMERERAASLWIMPRVDCTHVSARKGRAYPVNSLLGLPTEIRQNILYQTCNIAELEDETRKMPWIGEKPSKYHPSTRTADPSMCTTLEMSALARFELNTYEGKLVTMLSRKVGELSRVSPLIKSEMEHVSKKWQKDLETHLQVQLRGCKVSTDKNGLEWFFQPHLHPYMKPREGQVVKAKQRGPGKRFRARKCWYCTERHERGDKICPMARRAPKEWKETTKKVGGWRGRLETRSKAQGQKVEFE